MNLKTVKGCAPPTSSELLNIIIQSGLDFNSIPRAPENDVRLTLDSIQPQYISIGKLNVCSLERQGVDPFLKKKFH